MAYVIDRNVRLARFRGFGADAVSVPLSMPVLLAASQPASNAPGYPDAVPNYNPPTRTLMVSGEEYRGPYDTHHPVTKQVTTPLKTTAQMLKSYPAPRDYPIPNPTGQEALDNFLPAVKAKTRYGGLPTNMWGWLSWRKRMLWALGNDPGNDPSAIALLSPKEQSYFNADAARPGATSLFDSVARAVAAVPTGGSPLKAVLAPITSVAAMNAKAVEAIGGTKSIAGAALNALTQTVNPVSNIAVTASDKGLGAAIKQAPAELVAKPYTAANMLITATANTVGAKKIGHTFESSGSKAWDFAKAHPLQTAAVGAAAVAGGFVLAAAAPAGGFFTAAGGAAGGGAGAGAGAAAGGAAAGGTGAVDLGSIGLTSITAGGAPGALTVAPTAIEVGAVGAGGAGAAGGGSSLTTLLGGSGGGSGLLGAVAKVAGGLLKKPAAPAAVPVATATPVGAATPGGALGLGGGSPVPALVGAGVGFAVGGPLGAAIGGVLGLLVKM